MQCKFCKKEFTPGHAKAEFCNPSCRVAHHRLVRPVAKIPKSELLAAIDSGSMKTLRELLAEYGIEVIG